MQARQIAQAAPVADGLVELPPGKIAAIATYLEMRTRPSPGIASPALGGRLELIGGDLARYRALYRSVGEPWLWFSRAVMGDDALRAILADPAVEATALVRDGQDIGIAELDFRNPGECELSFFGLVASGQGQGLGRALMGEAIRRAFARPILRLWLHTCTLDHPAAMPFYVAMGFRPYRRAVEIADDPRLSGCLPRGAAPSFPVI